MQEQPLAAVALSATAAPINVAINGETIATAGTRPVVNAARWRKRKDAGAWKTTQSGLSVRVRRLSLAQMVISGEMPKPLQPDAEKIISSDVPVLEALRKHLPVIEAAIRIGVLEPKIVEGDVPADDDTQVSINELSLDDKIQIYQEISSVRGNLLPHQMLSFLETE